MFNLTEKVDTLQIVVNLFGAISYGIYNYNPISSSITQVLNNFLKRSIKNWTSQIQFSSLLNSQNVNHFIKWVQIAPLQ